MTHPCVAAITQSLSQLRADEYAGPIDPDTHLSPEVYFSIDTQQGTPQITLQELEGGLLKAALNVTGTPEWLTLNIGLGTGRFEIGDTIGLVTDFRGTDAFSTRPFIRSNRDGEAHDTALAEEMVFGGQPSISTLLHSITSEDALGYGEAFHTLVIPLPKRNLSLSLYDLRMFHIDGAQGGGAHAATLGSLAV